MVFSILLYFDRARAANQLQIIITLFTLSWHKKPKNILRTDLRLKVTVQFE